MEFAIGAMAALEARGSYRKVYRNTFHAAYIIARHEGIFALQSGIVPALGFQMILNGIRLGGYNLAKKYEVTVDGTGQVQIAGSLLVSGVTGCVGSAIASPFYLVIIWLLTSAHLASAAFS
jgi:solute carrier family 25 protein 34/35